MKEKIKTKIKIVIILQNFLSMVMNIGVMLLYAGIILVFVNAYIKYLRELPTIILIGIPIGFIAILTKIFTINWWGFSLSPEELQELSKKTQLNQQEKEE